MKTYNLFISHSWTYGREYERLVRLLRERPYFRFKNYSVPEGDPVHAGSVRALREAIRRQMHPCHVVIVLAGVYSTHSKWINEELDLAERSFTNSKPVLAVRPWGAERISLPVQRAADKIVGWNTDSVVGAIRELG